MTKQLCNIMKEYHVDFEYDGMEFDATVEVNTDEFDMGEADVRVISIDSLDDGEYEYGDIEEYILANWEEFEEIDGGGGG